MASPPHSAMTARSVGSSAAASSSSAPPSVHRPRPPRPPFPTAVPLDGDCPHLHQDRLQGQSYCTDCGESISSFCREESLFFEDASTVVSSERKASKSIRKELDVLDIPERVKNTANEIYARKVGNNTYRSSIRQNVKFSCIYEAYRVEGIDVDPRDIAKMLNVNKKGMSRGLILCSYLYTGVESTPRSHMTAMHYVKGMLEKSGVIHDESHLADMQKIYDYTYERSELLNRAQPQSVAASLIYFYLSRKGGELKVTKAEIAKHCEVSVMTLNKGISEFEAVCGQWVQEG